VFTVHWRILKNEGMRRLFIGLLVLLLSLEIKAQSSSLPIDSIYQLIKSKSVYRKTVDWNRVDQAFQNKVDSAKNQEDTLKAFVFVFKQLHDVHSAIYYKNQYFGHYKGVDQQTAEKIKPLLDRSTAQAGKMKAAFLANHFGYILIPTIQAFGEQINSYAQAIGDSLCKLHSSHTKGYIIDLRLNGGGNLYPMLAGLSAFLGNSQVGGEVDESGRMVRTWQTKNGNFYQGDYQQTNVKAYCKLDLSRMPVVVLLSSVTRSSGQATAVAFKGRSKTYFIGESTAEGYTTSNNYIQLRSDLALNLATEYIADRKGNVYKVLVRPDLELKGKDNFDQLMQDAKVKAAFDWLNKNIR